jgi:hypothetical protein
LGILGGAAFEAVRAGLAAVIVCCTAAAAQTAATEPTLRVTTDSVHREIIVELSPLNLPAYTAHHDAMQAVARAMVIPVTGWIEGYRGEMIDSAGRRLPNQLIHHLNLIVPQRRELFSTIMQRMGAAGAETPPVELPQVLGHPIIGYPVTAGDTLLISTMVHNPTGQTYDDARVRVHLSYATAGTWPKPIAIYPFYLDVMPPAGRHSYDLPAGHSFKSWQGHPAVAGRILAVGGHMHKYGVVLRFEDVTTHRVLWQSAPETDSRGEITGMPTTTYWWRLGIPVHPDHIYRLTAVYDNPTGAMIRDGAMGAFGGVFHPDDIGAWPVVDRSTPEYQRDVKETYSTDMADMDMDMDDMHDMRVMHGASASAAAGAHPSTPSDGNLTRRTAQTP